jgi:hypothetical protein
MRIYKTLEIMPDEDFPFIEDCSLGIGELLAEANCPNCGNEHPQEKFFVIIATDEHGEPFKIGFRENSSFGVMLRTGMVAGLLADLMRSATASEN